MVLAVRAQVLGQMVDALGEQGDLDLGRAGVAVLAAVLARSAPASFLRQRHRGGSLRRLAESSAASSATSRCICAISSSTPRKPPLAAQSGDERDAQSLARRGRPRSRSGRPRSAGPRPVSKVGLTPTLTAAGCPLAKAAYTPCPGATRSSWTGRGSRSGSQASRPRPSPSTTRPLEQEGRAEAPVGDVDLARGDQRSGCGSRRRSRHRARPAGRLASSNSGRAASISGSPFALAPKRKFSPTDTFSPRVLSTRILLAELLGGDLGELVIERDHHELLDAAGPRSRRRLMLERHDQLGASPSGWITLSGCGSKVRTVSALSITCRCPT